MIHIMLRYVEVKPSAAFICLSIYQSFFFFSWQETLRYTRRSTIVESPLKLVCLENLLKISHQPGKVSVMAGKSVGTYCMKSSNSAQNTLNPTPLHSRTSRAWVGLHRRYKSPSVGKGGELDQWWLAYRSPDVTENDLKRQPAA